MVRVIYTVYSVGTINTSLWLAQYMKIKHIKMDTGERLSLLLDDNGIPDFWATLYVCNLLRSQAQNTIEYALNVLKYLRSWEHYHERDLSQEFRMGRFLTDGDIQSLSDHCAYQVGAFKKWAAKDKHRSNSIRAVSASNLLAFKAPAPLKTVQFDTQYNRITTVAGYIKFVAETVCRVRPEKRESRTQIDQMYNGLLCKRPKSNSSKSRGRYAHITADSCIHFRDIVRLSHPDNPFKREEARLRNNLMVGIAYELGLRAGEILALWVEDIQFGPKPTLSVVRRHNHPLDPRPKQLVAKTQERMLPLSQELAAEINRYILNYRSKHPYADKHPILFVGSQNPWRGHPLSEKSFGKVFKKIKQVDPDRLRDISPHALRHDRACRFVDEMESYAAKTKKIRLTDADLERSLMDYFGWRNPNSAAVYLKRRTRARVDEAMRQYQRDTFRFSEEGNKE